MKTLRPHLIMSCSDVYDCILSYNHPVGTWILRRAICTPSASPSFSLDALLFRLGRQKILAFSQPPQPPTHPSTPPSFPFPPPKFHGNLSFFYSTLAWIPASSLAPFLHHQHSPKKLTTTSFSTIIALYLQTQLSAQQPHQGKTLHSSE